MSKWCLPSGQETRMASPWPTSKSAPLICQWLRQETLRQTRSARNRGRGARPARGRDETDLCRYHWHEWTYDEPRERDKGQLSLSVTFLIECRSCLFPTGHIPKLQQGLPLLIRCRKARSFKKVMAKEKSFRTRHADGVGGILRASRQENSRTR